MGDIIVSQGRTMDEPSVGTLATKSNGCANVDKGRLAFDRLRLFKGSDDGSKLIHYRDQETKGGRKNKRTDVVLTWKPTAAILAEVLSVKVISMLPSTVT
jgi:hypothetical protein